MRRLSSKIGSEGVGCFAQLANCNEPLANGAALPVAIRLHFLFFGVRNAPDCLVHIETLVSAILLASGNEQNGWLECLLDQHSLLVFLAVYFIWRNDHRGGHLVVGLKIQQAHALCITSSGANGVGVDADDFSPLADHHQL
jgi:hypothetical protein